MKIKWQRTAVLAIICLTMMFYVGMWTTDLGASMYNIECSTGIQTIAEGLVARDIEPTVVYHTGLMEMTASWLTLCGIAVWKIMDNGTDVPKGTSSKGN